MLKFSLKSHHPIRQIKSFKYAFEGIHHTFTTEPNFRIQVIIVALTVFLGKKFRVSNNEWGLLLLSLGWLLGAEILNTVIEHIMDYVHKDESYEVKVIKDISAGFVLTTSFTTLAILILVFADKLFLLISK